MIGFVIPAHDEELLIARTIQSIHNSARGLAFAYEIVVADDASTDSTAAIARANGARVVSIDRRQIAAARNAGARAALLNDSVRRLIFIDADTMLTVPVLRAANVAMDHGSAGGGSAVEFDGPVPKWADHMLAIFLAVFRVFKWCGGCFVFCTREAFEASGGWDETIFASEELYFAQAIKRTGRFVVLREPVITSGRKMRDYSAREIIGSLLRIGLSGRRAVRSRDALGLWYGPRRVGVD